MSDLIVFLLARITEDEDCAKGAYRDSVDDNGVCHMTWTDATEAVMFGDTAMVTGLEPSYLSDHIARHDPARVLAECEAKRQLIGGFSAWGSDAEWALGVLALPYADHPDYRDEWKP